MPKGTKLHHHTGCPKKKCVLEIFSMYEQLAALQTISLRSPDNFFCFFLTNRPVDFNQSAPLYVPTPNSDREAFMPVYINLLEEDHVQMVGSQ